MLRPFALVLLASVPIACSGSVVDNSSGRASSSSSGGTGTTEPLSCGDVPTVGKIQTACVPMDGGDYCLPAETSPGLLVELAKENNVCAETSPGACCDKPAYRQVVCDQPPGVNDCCYDVHYIDFVVCP